MVTTKNQLKCRKFSTTEQIIIYGILISLTFLSTWLIQIRIPFLPGNGGLIHLGNVPVLLAAAIFGKKASAISASLGMALFDLMSGWIIWAPFTFIIMGILGYTIGILFEKLNMNIIYKYIIILSVAIIIKVTGYYFAEVILYGNFIVPFGSIPGNITQIIVAGIISIPVIAKLNKMYK